MILSADLVPSLAWLAALAYLGAAMPVATARRWPLGLLVGAWILHALMLAVGTGWWSADAALGVRIGFAPVLSFTLWLVLAVHALESRLLPVAGQRRALALGGVAAVLLAALFPGDLRAVAHSPLTPLHWVLGLTSYGLFATAVLHGLMLDASEQRLRSGLGRATGALGMPLLRLERLTFRFVEGGFVVLTLALLLGAGAGHWRWDHKTVLSLLGWATFAALIVGRVWRGWRGRQATRWLYAGALLLLLAYVGSRFVMEVVLSRAVA